MLTAEVKINGTLIGFLYITRTKTGANAKKPSRYNVEYYEPGENPVRFNVEHIPIFGALDLIETAISAIREEVKK